MGIADIMDPIYITGAPKTFLLKLCIGLIVGLVAHRIARINESSDKKYVWKWSLIATIAGLGFNVIADPLAGYFIKCTSWGSPADGGGSGKMEYCSYVCQCGDLYRAGRSHVQRPAAGTAQIRTVAKAGA